MCCRFDESTQHVELDYPRDMAMWKDVPYGGLDSAFKLNGTKYVVKLSILLNYIILVKIITFILWGYIRKLVLLTYIYLLGYFNSYYFMIFRNNLLLQREIILGVWRSTYEGKTPKSDSVSAILDGMPWQRRTQRISVRT